jgi:general stress protein YciG
MSNDEKQVVPQGTPDPNTPNEKIETPPDTLKNVKQADLEPAARPPEGEPRVHRRGFAAMDRDRVKQIASKGGRAAHAAGTAHQFSSAEARVAGKKGGEAPHVRRGGVRRRPAV